MTNGQMADVDLRLFPLAARRTMRDGAYGLRIHAISPVSASGSAVSSPSTINLALCGRQSLCRVCIALHWLVLFHCFCILSSGSRLVMSYFPHGHTMDDLVTRVHTFLNNDRQVRRLPTFLVLQPAHLRLSCSFC